jgi:hypothetical protein
MGKQATKVKRFGATLPLNTEQILATRSQLDV